MVDMTRQIDRTAVPQNGNQQELASAGERFVTPRASVLETKDEVLIEMEMPGVVRDGIDITLDRDELTITAKRKADDYRGEILHQERLPNSFRRSFVLSERIDGNGIKASYDNGVLYLALPKTEDQKPKKIQIQ